jgi:hypothetical protein
MNRAKILVECFNDETLFLSFKISKYDIEHNLDGKSEVFDKIEKRNNCLAVIDNDKRTEHKYFKKAEVIEELANDIKIFKESERDNYILVFYPKLEKVIERIISENDKNVSTSNKLGLKIDTKSLHDIGRDKQKLTKLKQLYDVLLHRSTELKEIEKYL